MVSHDEEERFPLMARLNFQVIVMKLHFIIKIKLAVMQIFKRIAQKISFYKPSKLPYSLYCSSNFELCLIFPLNTSHPCRLTAR